MTDSLGGKARNAAKWSLISEAAAKIITPVTQLVLARILSPDAFGVLATVIMVGSFGEMLSGAGFQKYLIQHEFRDQKALYRAANVAFWSSMAVAVCLLALIVVFRDSIATLVGNPGLGVPIAVACLSLPISVFVSSQQALFRRSFEYKKLLPVRITVAIVPLVVSVPLALLGFTYWSLIIGTLAAALVNAVWMTIVSPWKPGRYFSFPLLRKMFAFSSWSLLEAIAIWATVWSGTFVVGSLLNPHDLGLYRQPILVVNSLFALITNATTPILFAALSRLQADRDGFRRFFFRFQFTVAIALFPIGVGAFFYRDFLTNALFGAQWTGAALMFGAWSLTTCTNIVMSHYCSEIFRALGRPRISFLAQILYMAVMIPSIYFAALHSFTTLVIVNAGVRVVAIIIGQIFTYFVAGFGFIQVMRNLYAPALSAAVMGAVAAWLSSLTGNHWGWSILGILACAVVYLLACLCFPRTRAVIADSRAMVFGVLANTFRRSR
nr:lipopolysaccharide biosynthesis protein [Actinomycetota bacterium]